MNDFERFLNVFVEGTFGIMLPLAFVCIAIAVITVERFLYLYDPRQLLLRWFPGPRRKTLNAQKNLAASLGDYLNEANSVNRDKLIGACSQYNTPYSEFLISALRGLGGSPKGGEDLVLHRETLRSEVAIDRAVPLLSMLATVAPLIGLLGTVTGMIQTFTALMNSANSDPKTVSMGISVALIGTAAGLVVGIPGVIFAGVLQGRGQTLVSEIRLAAFQLLESPGNPGKEGRAGS